MKTSKRILAALLAAFLLLLTVSVSFVAFCATDYLFSYTYSDIQAEKSSDEQRYAWVDKNGQTHYDCNIITAPREGWGGQDLPCNDASRGISRANTIYLAKNEREGFQVYFYEKGTGRNLRLEVGDFTNANGDVLAHEVFREEYFTPIGSSLNNPDGSALVLADALIPCGDSTEVQTVQNQNEMFYIEVRSTPDQPAGVYYADVKLYDGETALTPTKNTTRVAAVVWDFALPQQHYGSMTVGLYNTASNYGACAGFLRYNGVDVNGWGNSGDLGDGKTEEDREKLDTIVEGWQEYLLDHGITTYELPRHLIDTDPKAAELAMADVRRKSFFIPLIQSDASNNSYDAETLAKIEQYKDVIGDNEALLKKAAFYVKDEPDLATNAGSVQSCLTAAESAWPEVRRFVSYCNTNIPYETAKTQLKPNENIVCLNTNLLARSQTIFNDYVSSNYAYRWRYHGDMLFGGVELWRHHKSTNGMLRRILFWQQHAMNEDTFLYWNCAYFTKNVWEDHILPSGDGTQTGNGNGILLYPGVPVGQPAETPIASLRLKQAASGIDDADYLALAKEFMNEEDYTTYLRSFLRYANTEEKSHQLFLTDGEGEWASFGMDDSTALNKARIALGNALETAVGEHVFGAWETIVTPDETHNGLQIRTCENCGTQESQKIGLCDEGHHCFGDPVVDNAETHTSTCTVCGATETAAHTPKTVPGTAATCTADGSTDSVVCADCGYVITAAEVIPGGHKLGDWINEDTATCTKEGTKGHYQCSVCKKFFDANHNEITDLIIPKAAHQWSAGTVTTQPTCTAAGVKTFQCQNCTAAKTEPVPASGHSWGGWTVIKQPTCTAEGQQVRICARDSSHKEIYPIAKKPHTDNGNGYCRDCGADLLGSKRCKYCGKAHTGPFGWLIKFFHLILSFFK